MTRATYRLVLWILSATWVVATVLTAGDHAPLGIFIGLFFGVLTVLAFRFRTFDKDRAGTSRETRSDFWLAVGVPLLFVFGSLMPIRDQPAPGVAWGIAAAAGFSVALAAWFSWKWRKTVPGR